jgi:hypothetical protein
MQNPQDVEDARGAARRAQALLAAPGLPALDAIQIIEEARPRTPVVILQPELFEQVMEELRPHLVLMAKELRKARRQVADS